MANPAPALSAANEIFNLIRGQEANFPFPVKKRTVTIGTFDAATGRFSYAVPTFEEEFENPLPGKPPKVVEGGRVNAIGAIEVILRFAIKNRKGEVSVAIPGLPTVRAATDAILVSIGAAESTKFTIVSGNKKFTSALPLEINRFVVGAGVFELPAFPVAIIYAPPPDRDLKNASRSTVGKTTGNTSSISIGEEKSTSNPVTPDFAGVNQVASDMKLVAKGVDLLNKAFNNPTLTGISKGLNIIAGGLGSSSTTEVEGASANQQHSLTLSVTREQTITTNAASGGPGSGDLIHYLKNVKLAWFTQDVGRLRVSVIGHDGIGVTSVGFLKSGGQTDLDPATVAEFLKLDPFVAGGPSAVLPPKRFVHLDTIDVNGGKISVTETHTLTTADSKQTTTTRTRIRNNRAGFLSFLGLGVTEDLSETVVKHSSAVQSSSDTRKVSNTITLFARPDERYSVEVYCDVIFGTFAYRLAATSPTPLLKGTARSTDGKIAAGQIVTLINEGRKFTTRADAAGRYAFHATAIKTGKFEISVAGIKKTGTLAAGKPTFNIQT